MKELCTTQRRPVKETLRPAARRAKTLRSESGQSIYELALLTPLLLPLLIGAIELGRYAYISILVGNAARAGAAYGAQSLAQSADATGIQAATASDFQNNGQNVSTLTINGGFAGPSYIACGCDNNGMISPDPPTATYCIAANNPTAGSCPAGSHWVVLVSVEAKGTFNSLFSYLPSLKSITFDKTCTMRVNQ